MNELNTGDINIEGLSNGSLNKCIYELVISTIFVEICSILSNPEKQRCLKDELRRLSSSKYDNQVYDRIINSTIKEEIPLEWRSRLYTLIRARLQKSNTRKRIPKQTISMLLKQQEHKCAICTRIVEKDYCVDHIIPFVYVGDELENNFQVLCNKCNAEKNRNIFYQTRALLRNVIIK